MAFSFRRQTGFSRYMDVLEQNIKRFLFTNLLTLIGFLPFFAGVSLAILSSSVLVLIPSCLIGGIFAGPALSCMYDTIMRSLRDETGKCFATCKHAWKQNWRQSLYQAFFFALCWDFTFLWLCYFGGQPVFPDGERLPSICSVCCCLPCSFLSAGHRLFYLNNPFLRPEKTVFCLPCGSLKRYWALPCSSFCTGPA